MLLAMALFGGEAFPDQMILLILPTRVLMIEKA